MAERHLPTARSSTGSHHGQPLDCGAPQHSPYVEKVRRWCRERAPTKFADEVRPEVSTRGKSISIHECRPVWRGAPGEWTKMPIAQIRYEG
jgi:hypothetical protein